MGHFCRSLGCRIQVVGERIVAGAGRAVPASRVLHCIETLDGVLEGIWFGKSQRACNAALPVLDFWRRNAVLRA